MVNLIARQLNSSINSPNPIEFNWHSPLQQVPRIVKFSVSSIGPSIHLKSKPVSPPQEINEMR